MNNIGRVLASGGTVVLLFTSFQGPYAVAQNTAENGPAARRIDSTSKDNSRDAVTGVDGQVYTSDQATIWRWRTAFQHDFAARMDWTSRLPAMRITTRRSP